VSQEPTLFTITIRDNIACGKDNAIDEKIRTTIWLVNVVKFIDKLPKVKPLHLHPTEKWRGQKKKREETKGQILKKFIFL